MRIALAYPMAKKCAHLCNSPLSLLYLATSLRDTAGAEVKVFDVDAYPGGLRELIDKVVDYKPDIIGTPILTEWRFLNCVRDFCQTLKQKLPNVRIVAGGAHPGAMPDETLAWYPEIDMLLMGEADFTLCELVKQLESNVAEPEVPGLCYRGSGAVVKIPLGVPPKDLDAIPIPDRRLMWDNYKNGIYWRMDQKGISDFIMTGRGCPFNCRFCFKVVRGYRQRSAEHVVKELVDMASLGITSIDFEDDLFTANKKRCLKICQLIRDAGLKLDLKVRSRVDTIDAELLSEFRKSGVKAVVFGIESGSQAVLDAMGKKATVKLNLDAIKMTKKAGLRCHADFFIGFPGETRETIAETEAFLRKALPTVINGGVLTPLPCTAVYDEAKANGTLMGEWAVGDPQPWVKLPWIEDIRELQIIANEMTSRYYRTPAVVMGMMRHAPLMLNKRQLSAAARFIKHRVFMK